MKKPKILFKSMTLQENLEIIKWAYYEENRSLDIHKCLVYCFPKLDNIPVNYSKEEIDKYIEDIISNAYYKYLDKINSEVERYNKIWKEYNDIYFNTLSEYLNIDWSNIDIIVATVGLIPVFPRNLNDYSFSIGIDIEDWNLLRIAAHETLHFLWFKKWKQLYPNIPTTHYESPYIEWQYSEMVTDPILNNKPFSDIFAFIEHGYDSFYKLTDGDELVMDKLRSIYAKDISIEEKINIGYKYISKYLKQYK